MPTIKDLSHYEFCRASTTAFIFWEILVARCASNFEGKEMRARRICQRIINQVQLLSTSFRPKTGTSLIQNHILGIIGIQPKNLSSKPGRWFHSERLIEGWVKLNVDWSAKYGLTSGWEIICNDNGAFVAAFSTFYGKGTNNSAEFLALNEGLELCKAMGLMNVIIECDSQIVVNAIKQREVTN